LLTLSSRESIDRRERIPIFLDQPVIGQHEVVGAADESSTEDEPAITTTAGR